MQERLKYRYCWERKRGISCIDMPAESMILRSKHSQKRQKDLVGNDFNDDIVSVDQVPPIPLEQCDVVATRMRRKGKKCISVSVTFRTLISKNNSSNNTSECN